MKISIVLLIKNGGKFLPKLLSVLNGQKGDFEKELIIINSGSSDENLNIFHGYAIAKIGKIRIYKIKPEDFGHGKTRNFAVSKCRGEIVVFLSQDALPIGQDWLENLIRGFGEIGVVGVFGKQIPYPGTNEIEKYFYQISYPNVRKILEEKDSGSFSNQNLFFSNANGAVKKEFLKKFPFREDLIMSEDQFWGREVLKNGYKIVYEPKASVYHSHNYNLINLFQRYYQIGLSQKQIGLLGNVWKSGGRASLGLLKYVIRRKIWFLPYTILYLLIKGGAFWLGKMKIPPVLYENKLLRLPK